MNESGWQVQRTRTDTISTNSQPLVRPTPVRNGGLHTSSGSNQARARKPRRSKGRLSPGVTYRVEGKFDPFAEAERIVAERLRKDEEHGA